MADSQPCLLETLGGIHYTLYTGGWVVKGGKEVPMLMDVQTQSFTAIWSFHFFIFSLTPCKPEAPKLVCPFVIIVRRIIVSKLVQKYKFWVFIHFDRTLWLFSGKIEASTEVGCVYNPIVTFLLFENGVLIKAKIAYSRSYGLRRQANF